MQKFHGPFASGLSEHILIKQSIGYDYTTEVRILMQFDRFTAETYPCATELTKEIAADWCSKRSYESQKNQFTRVSTLRQFTLYLNRIGKPGWVIPNGFCPKGNKYIPYIYTDNELCRFFTETDKCKFVSECPYRHLVMPLLFRMIYSCGLRCSEARLLKVSDVDLSNGILSVVDGKNENSRLIPISSDLLSRCREFFKRVHTHTTPDDWFFPGQNGKAITLGNVYKNFRKFLFAAGISHHGRGKGPRVHDFRHTFACNCLKKWVREGKDLNVYLPVLKTYMGHKSLSDTAYYLQLTADVYSDISDKLDEIFNELIQLDGGGSDG